MISKSINYKEYSRVLDLAVNIILLDYLEERLTTYLDKIRFFIYNAFNILINKFIIYRELKRLNFSRKKYRRIIA